MRRLLTAVSTLVALFMAPLLLQAQAPARAAAVPSARAIAPVDLTGYWVSVISEDWQWRMFTPPKGDYASLPLNADGTRVANQWTPAEDGSCKAYGAAGLLRMPTRVHITWEDDHTLKIESDAGRQTRRLRFASVAPVRPAARDLQGSTTSQWQVAGVVTSSGANGGVLTSQPAIRTWGTLKAVTTNLRAGWLRRNGVPYSEHAIVTEYFDHFADEGDEWFTVTTIVEDPTYLTQPMMVSSNFKKEPDGSKWAPTACRP